MEIGRRVFKKIDLKSQNLVVLILLAIFILPAVWALFRPGFFVSDDGEWMIIRFSAFHQSLVDGQFPVRWLGRLNHGYGYPVANFLYPGFMYLAEIPKILGFGFTSSIKIILGLSISSSGFFFYLWLRKFFGRFPAFFGALSYVYAPYHLYDVYTRGSVGETLALAIAPFILWQLERRSLFWSTVGIGFLIISHNTLAILFLSLVVLYMIMDIFITEKGKKLFTFCRSLFIIFLALGLSAFFWVPAIFDLQYTVFSKTPVSEWNEYFADQKIVGFATITIFLLVFTLFLARKIRPTKHRLTVLLFTTGFLSLFFSLPLSTPLWHILPVSFVQFPFRFLSLTILCTSFLAACILSVLPKRISFAVGLIVFLLILVSSKPFIVPSQFFNKGDAFYATNEATTTVKGEYMPHWVKVFPTEHPSQKVEIAKGKGKIESPLFTSREVLFKLSLKEDSLVQINTIYFPGWQAWVDGKKIAIDYGNEKGVIQIPVDRGDHQALIKFSETPLRLFSDIISLFSLLVLSGLTLRKYFHLNR